MNVLKHLRARPSGRRELVNKDVQRIAEVEGHWNSSVDVSHTRGDACDSRSEEQLAGFLDRSTCIACGSARLSDLSTGAYDSGHVGDFLRADPWGEDPLPYLAGRVWHFVKCEGCGQMFHRFVLDAKWNERRFTQWMTQDAIVAFEKTALAPDFRFDKAAQDAAHVLRIRSLLGPGVRLLDFGCGYGEFISMCNLYGFRAVGVDRAQAKRGNALVPIFPELSALSGPFEAVTLFEVLEHLDDPLGILERLAKLMAPDGVLVLETPDCTGVTDIQTIDDYRKIHPLDHINAFTPETLRNIAERAGFASVSRPTAHVTSDRLRVAKAEVKRMFPRRVRGTTQQYFRKTCQGAQTAGLS